jgi:hypothetical protein
MTKTGGETMAHRIGRILPYLSFSVLAIVGSPWAAPQSPPTLTVAPPVFSGVKGAPYSGEETTVRTQHLADGTTITHQSRARVYRDSEGRTRREMFAPESEASEPGDTLIAVEIFDPTTGVSYRLNPRDHTARKTDVTARRTSVQTAQTSAPPAHRPSVPPSTREDLGTQVIEGVQATGRRFTQIIPAGAQGNDQPMEIVHESWSSPELHVTLMQASRDPRWGETVTHLTKIARDEPPAELFQVPPDYTLEELQPVTAPE